MKPQPLVIGMGNEFRGDDAAGVHVARLLKNRAIPGFDVVETSGEGTELMRLWEDYDTVFLVDAVQSRNQVGEIYRFTCRDIEKFQKWFHCSSHVFSLPQALQMAKELDKLPAHVVIFGIEGVCFDFSEKMTPEVTTSVEIVLSLLLKELTPLIPCPSKIA